MDGAWPAANGIDYAYRETGEGSAPLVLLQGLPPMRSISDSLDSPYAAQNSSRTLVSTGSGSDFWAADATSASPALRSSLTIS
jgi:hypothetical protein